jgi:hypothetical protein
LMKGSIVSAGEGNRNAARDAKGAINPGWLETRRKGQQTNCQAPASSFARDQSQKKWLVRLRCSSAPMMSPSGPKRRFAASQ